MYSVRAAKFLDYVHCPMFGNIKLITKFPNPSPFRCAPRILHGGGLTMGMYIKCMFNFKNYVIKIR